MKKAGLLMPSLCLFTGMAIGHYSPSHRSPDPASATGQPTLMAPAAFRASRSAARPPQPVLTEWLDFLQILEKATLAELPALWETLLLPDRQPPAGPGTSARHRMLIERWAELDPAGAVTFIKEKAPGENPLFEIIFQTWAQQDPETALTILQGEPNPDIQERGIVGFLLSFREHPDKLIQWARRFSWVDASDLKKVQFSAVCPDALLLRGLEADRAGLYEIAAHLPPWFLQHLENLILLHQAATDLPAVLSAIQSRRFTQKEAISFAENLGTLAKTHPASAIALLDALNAASDGSPLINNGTSEQIGGPLVKYLASSDPVAAAAFITKHLDVGAKYALGEKIYQELFASNPAAALIVASALLPFSVDLISLPSFNDRQSALTILPDAPPSWRRDRALQTTLDQWQRESPAEAQAWLDALPPGEWRDRAAVILSSKDRHQNLISLQLQDISLRQKPALTAVDLKEVETTTSMAAQADLRGTLAHLAEWPPGPARQSALEIASTIAAQQSTAKALAWAQQLPNASASAEAIRGVVGVWTEHEPLAASEWLPTLAPGPVREVAVDRFSEKITPIDPAAALTWAATLTDPGSRANRLEATYRAWSADDPAGAAAALAEIPGLSPADLQQLRTPATPAAK